MPNKPGMIIDIYIINYLFMKIIYYLILGFICFFIGLGIILNLPPKQLYGKDIVYSCKFKSSTPATIDSKDILFFECTEENVEVVVTSDTVEIRSNQGTIGLKPMYLTKEQQLFCAKQDGTVVVLIRYLPKNALPELKNEHLIIIIGDKLVILNPTKDCLKQIN